MLNISQIQTSIFKWARGNSGGVKVIWAEQSEHRPPRPYVTLKMLLGPQRIGHDSLSLDDLGRSKASGIREITVSVNAFGSGSAQILSDLQSSLELPTVQEKLSVGGAVFVDTTPLNDLSQLMDTRFESRTQMDVRFRVASEAVDEESGTIGKVTLTNQITDEESDIEET